MQSNTETNYSIPSGVERALLRMLAAETGPAVILCVLKFSEIMGAARTAPAGSFNINGLGPLLPALLLPPLCKRDPIGMIVAHRCVEPVEWDEQEVTLLMKAVRWSRSHAGSRCALADHGP